MKLKTAFAAPETAISLQSKSTLSALKSALNKTSTLARHPLSSFWIIIFFAHCQNVPLEKSDNILYKINEGPKKSFRQKKHRDLKFSLIFF